MTWGNRHLPLSDRFWSRVDRRGPDDCWSWTGTTTGDGYGEIKDRKVRYLAHRLAWMLTMGPIPDGAALLHSCDRRSCCNPRHLAPGSPAENSADMVRKGRSARGERVHGARLTEVDVVAIRTSRARGASFHSLARRYGVARTTIKRLTNRVTWAHVA